jgi:hypothetical protein
MDTCNNTSKTGHVQDMPVSLKSEGGQTSPPNESASCVLVDTKARHATVRDHLQGSSEDNMQEATAAETSSALPDPLVDIGAAEPSAKVTSANAGAMEHVDMKANQCSIVSLPVDISAREGAKSEAAPRKLGQHDLEQGSQQESEEQVAAQEKSTKPAADAKSGINGERALQGHQEPGSQQSGPSRTGPQKQKAMEQEQHQVQEQRLRHIHDNSAVAGNTIGKTGAALSSSEDKHSSTKVAEYGANITARAESSSQYNVSSTSSVPPHLRPNIHGPPHLNGQKAARVSKFHADCIHLLEA